MKMKIAIAPLTIDRYTEVVALWRLCEGIGLSDADSRESIAAYLERNPGMSFIATIDGTLGGAVLCGHDARRGYLHHLAVHPRFRNKGIGRQLVDLCLAALRDAGIQKCHLFALNGNLDGITFWESVGWTRRNEISVLSRNIGPGIDAPGADLHAGKLFVELDDAAVVVLLVATGPECLQDFHHAA